MEETQLIGLALQGKTSNKNGQSNIDCGRLWQKFEKENYSNKIPHKSGDEIFAVYHSYDDDHTQPFSYFIGHKVSPGTQVPEGLDSLTIPQGALKKITAKGKMPDCIINSWQEIWNSDIPRAYSVDFEVYDQRSKDWKNAEVDIYISLKE